MNDVTNPQSDRINPDFVQQYIIENAKFFPEDSINELKARLSKLSQNQFNAIQGIQLKDPMIMLLLSSKRNWIRYNKIINCWWMWYLDYR